MENRTYYATKLDEKKILYYGNIWDLLSDMRGEVETFVSAFALDVMYDSMQIGRKVEGSFIWFVRECGTYLLDVTDSRTSERLRDYKRNYSKYRIYAINVLEGDNYELELLGNTYNVE